jgi:SAM-dependent methyltransferase
MTNAAPESQQCVACGTVIDPIEHYALRKDGFDLVACPKCRMLMRAALPTVSDLNDIYGPEYFAYAAENPVDGYADYFADAGSHREIARRRLAMIDRLSVVRGRLLDVGAAAGFFVDEARAAGWDAEGIDIAPQVVDWGRQKLGVPLRVAGISSVEEAGTFDAVTMWDYIEHSLDPAGEVQQANELLQRGGILAISTGDVDSAAARIFRSHWHLLTPRHHNFFFSLRTLSALLRRSGFEIAWSGHPGASYSIAHLVYKLDRGVRIGATASLARRVGTSRIGRYRIPLNLFDIVTVIARKPV